jgi:hypothetical protein
MPLPSTFLPVFDPSYFAHFQISRRWFGILRKREKFAFSRPRNLGLSNFNISIC